MYFRLVSQCITGLKRLDHQLDKAEELAKAKKFDVQILLGSRLAPDMKIFSYQVQSACDYVKAAAGWLSGQHPPKHQDDEITLDDIRARIRKTIEFVESITEEQYVGAQDRQVKLSWQPGKVIFGADYLTQVTVPNVYFHLAMAYAILRHNGVDIGKMDFLGPMNLVDART